MLSYPGLMGAPGCHPRDLADPPARKAPAEVWAELREPAREADSLLKPLTGKAFATLGLKGQRREWFPDGAGTVG